MTLDERRLERYPGDATQYRLAIVTDEDHDSQVTLEDGQVAWRSTLRYDRLYRETDAQGRTLGFRVEPIPEAEGGVHHLISLIAEGGRGAEFSELALFGNRLLTFDDRTGLVCEIRRENQLIPRQILMTGSGDEAFKGFKSEWATLKGERLIVGSHGKTPAEEWIKVLDADYRLESVDWHNAYQRMREALGIEEPGYVVHEAAEWHPQRRQWLFFPRKISSEPFDEAVDERERAGDTLLIGDEHFSHIECVKVGGWRPERGVSSIKVLPGRPGECIGLRSVEIEDHTETYLFCFDLDGNVLMADQYLGDYKCEGIEFL